MSDEQPNQAETERRQVKVSDPRLSSETKEMLTREAQEVVGDSKVRVPRDRPHSAEGGRPLASGSLLNVTGVRLMITIIASALGVIVAVVAILQRGWLVVSPDSCARLACAARMPRSACFPDDRHS